MSPFAPAPPATALDVVTNQHLTPQEWTNVVQTMSGKGAAATPAELNIIQSYLAKRFREWALKRGEVYPRLPLIGSVMRST